MPTVSVPAGLGLQRILAARVRNCLTRTVRPIPNCFRLISGISDRVPVSAIGLMMVAAANLVEVAALVSDTARAAMLNALMGGQSLTATELAYCANVSRLDGERPPEQA